MSFNAKSDFDNISTSKTFKKTKKNEKTTPKIEITSTGEKCQCSSPGSCRSNIEESTHLQNLCDKNEKMTEINEKNQGTPEGMKKELSGIFTQDEEFDFLNQIEKNKKATSLKVKKSSDTCCEKKVVRFSDALGLELTTIRMIANSNEPPVVPESALTHLKVTNLEAAEILLTEGYERVTRLCLCFSSPVYCPDFYKRLEDKKVMLENCSVDNLTKCINGSIRVINIAYEKDVKICYSFNNWLTYDELGATYDSSDSRSGSDRFKFKIYVPETFTTFNSLQFFIKYTANNHTYYDNNYESNYRVECYENKLYT